MTVRLNGNLPATCLALLAFFPACHHSSVPAAKRYPLKGKVVSRSTWSRRMDGPSVGITETNGKQSSCSKTPQKLCRQRADKT